MVIDSRIGGMGDVWMRLFALYTLSGIKKQQHTLIVKAPLLSLSQALFGDRITITAEGEADVVYTHYGLRHLLPGMTRGVKYVHPFHWVLKETRKHKNIKDSMNDFAIGMAAQLGRILLPVRKYVWEYQGFMELSALDVFSHVQVNDFEIASKEDWKVLSKRLHDLIPHKDVHGVETIVFPSGTAHQIMPPSFAKSYLPSASFAFHINDAYAQEYAEAGLKVKYFSSLEEMLALGCDARFVICTDSFPSHLWQTWGRRVVIVLSQQTAKQVVHPGFPKAQVVNSMAPCVRCRSRGRTHPKDICDTGKIFCETWSNLQYITSLREAISS